MSKIGKVILGKIDKVQLAFAQNISPIKLPKKRKKSSTHQKRNLGNLQQGLIQPRTTTRELPIIEI